MVITIQGKNIFIIGMVPYLTRLLNLTLKILTYLVRRYNIRDFPKDLQSTEKSINEIKSFLSN